VEDIMPAKSYEKMRAFIITPFEKKKDSKGNEIDFDLVRTKLIESALDRLGVTAAHVIFGHTHRSGPWPHDDPAEWATRAGGRLHNTGSWVYQPHFLSGPGRSPYWPGTVVIVEEDGPPRLVGLLAERDEAELRPPGRA
jgi:hypothetical protein